MACYTLDNGKLIRWKGMACVLGMMEKFTRGSGRMICLKDKESSLNIKDMEK